MKHFLTTLAWWAVFAGVFALLTWVHGDPSPVPVSGGYPQGTMWSCNP